MPQPLEVDTAELRLNSGRLDALNGTTSAQLTQNADALAGCQTGWAGTAFAAFERVRDTGTVRMPHALIASATSH